MGKKSKVNRLARRNSYLEDIYLMSDEASVAEPGDDEPGDEETSTTTSTEIVDCKESVYTPAQSSNLDNEEDLSRLSLNDHSTEGLTTCPWKGKTYVILESTSKRAITIRDGEMAMIDTIGLSNPLLDVSCHWVCTEDPISRWWGFRNVVTGTYLGDSYLEEEAYEEEESSNFRLVDGIADPFGLVASSDFFEKGQWFCLRQHPDGGYELLISRHEALEPVIIVNKDTSCEGLVVGGNGDPARWLFMEA